MKPINANKLTENGRNSDVLILNDEGIPSLSLLLIIQNIFGTTTHQQIHLIKLTFMNSTNAYRRCQLWPMLLRTLILHYRDNGIG